MNRRQKIITTCLWVFLLACTLVLTALWSQARLRMVPRSAQAEETAPLFEVPPFELTDQENRTITLASLKNRPWVADFIFTRCPGPCPIMTANLAALQAKLPDAVRLVSFSLDPEYDTPEVLRAYGEKYNADPTRWHFLTGNAEVIHQLADAMKIAAQRAPNPIDIQHGTHFVLVNPDGKVHGYYRHDDPESQQQLIADAKMLAR